mgnify:CR=1 FL=1
MKIILTLIITLLSTSSFSKELFYNISKKTKEKITIVNVADLDMNSACAKNKKKCLEVITKTITNPKKIQDHKLTVGNPASDFCQANGGSSAILEDEKYNEYDYCIFANTYFIDSWNFFKKYNKNE